MIKIRYRNAISTNLEEEFVNGFRKISVVKASHDRPISIVLWQSEEKGLSITCVMHDIAERFEIGVLSFTRAIKISDNAHVIDMPEQFRSRLKVFKLCVTDGDVNAESGLVLQAVDGAEICILVGVFPYTLSIRAPFLMGKFEPEYPFSEYVRESFDTKE